tara:strand:- start:138 stop:1817 length:1680 start_codon:yes stop_codon:yes gene_type:complete
MTNQGSLIAIIIIVLIIIALIIFFATKTSGNCKSPSGCAPSDTAPVCTYDSESGGYGWVCDPGSDPDPKDVSCKVGDDGKLNYPIAYDDKLTKSTNPGKHYKTYKEITISDAKGCELASCESDYDVSDNSSFCVNPNKGKVCDDTDPKNKQFDSDAYSVYPDPNATWTNAYKFPDGDTPYCKFDTCIDGYSFDTTSKKCGKGGGDKGNCPPRPEHADPTTSQCESDGTWYITKCDPDDTYNYKPSPNNQKCEKSNCVTTCGRMESKCILDNTNESDIYCSAYGNQPMGDDKEKIMAHAMKKGNMSLDSTGGIVALKGSVKNPWGGCGTKDLPEFMPKPDTRKCVVPDVLSRFKFTAWTGSGSKAGCTECAALICPPDTTEESDCINYHKGCTNVEDKGSDWTKQCKDDHDEGQFKHMSWGHVESDYMPLVWTTVTIIPPWADWDIDGLTIRSFDKDCNQKYVSGNINEAHASEKVEVPIQVGGYVVFSAMHHYTKGLKPKKRYEHVAYKYDTLISLLPKGKQVEAAEYVFTTGCKDKRVYVKGLSNTGDITPPKCIQIV